MSDLTDFDRLRMLHHELQGRVDGSKLAALWDIGDRVRDLTIRAEGAADTIARLTAERDEARAEIERLRGYLRDMVEDGDTQAWKAAIDALRTGEEGQ